MKNQIPVSIIKFTLTIFSRIHRFHRACQIIFFFLKKEEKDFELDKQNATDLVDISKAWTTSPPYQAAINHRMNQIFVCNELQMPFGRQCTQIIQIQQLALHGNVDQSVAAVKP